MRLAELWRGHYKDMLNSCIDDCDKNYVINCISNISMDNNMYVNLNEVIDVVQSLPNNMSPGMDGCMISICMCMCMYMITVSALETHSNMR